MTEMITMNATEQAYYEDIEPVLRMSMRLPHVGDNLPACDVARILHMAERDVRTAVKKFRALLWQALYCEDRE